MQIAATYSNTHHFTSGNRLTVCVSVSAVWTITSDKCKKTTFIKTVIGDVVVIFVMYYFITTVPVAFY